MPKLSQEEFNKCCEEFKLGVNLSVNILSSNPSLIDFCSSFHLFPPKFTPIEYDTIPENYLDRWYWLWDNVSMDFSLMETALGISEEQLETFYKRLILLKLIFPDGSLDTSVNDLLTNLMAVMVDGEDKKENKKGR